MTDLLDDLFHRCALIAGFVAHAEGKLADSLYVRELCYRMYEDELARKNGPTRAIPTAHENCHPDKGVVIQDGARSPAQS